MKKRNKIISLLVVLTLFIGLVPAASALSTDFPDMPAEDFWSYPALSYAIENGLLQGSDGKLLPEGNLTRAQMSTILVRAFKSADLSAEFSFSDVASWQWFAGDLSRAVRMDIINGYPDGSMKPDAPITREQAFALLARAFSLTETNALDKTFTDVADVSAWAKGVVYAMVNAGYVQGSNDKINPLGYITRGEFAQLMSNMIKEYINVEGTYTEVSTGNIMVNVPDVILKDVTVTGDLIIGDGVGNGDVTLDNVKVEGRLLVRGGGENSIKLINNSYVGTLIINKDADGTVRVYAEDGTEIETVHVEDGFDNVILEGTYPAVSIVGDGVAVYLTDANVNAASVEGSESKFVVGKVTTVTNLVVTGSNATVDVEEEGKVETVTVKGSASDVAITGKGEVSNVNVTEKASNVKIEIPNTKISVDSTAGAVTGGGGKTVDPGTTATNNTDGTDITGGATPGGGGGGGGDPGIETDTLYLTVDFNGFNAVFEYEFDVKADIGSVLSSFFADEKNLINNGLTQVLDKLEGLGPITIGEGTGQRTFTLEDLYSYTARKTVAKLGEHFTDISAFQTAVDSGKVFDNEGNLLDEKILATNLANAIDAALLLIESGALIETGTVDALAETIHEAYFDLDDEPSVTVGMVKQAITKIRGGSATIVDLVGIFGDFVAFDLSGFDASNLVDLMEKKGWMPQSLSREEMQDLAEGFFGVFDGKPINITIRLSFEPPQG